MSFGCLERMFLAPFWMKPAILEVRGGFIPGKVKGDYEREYFTADRNHQQRTPTKLQTLSATCTGVGGNAALAEVGELSRH